MHTTGMQTVHHKRGENMDLKFLKKWLYTTFREGWISSSLVRILLYISLGIIMYLLLMGQVIPKTYELKENQKSPITLESPISVVDEAETLRLQNEAEKMINDQYTKDETIITDQLLKQDEFFVELQQILSQEDISKNEKVELLKANSKTSYLSDESLNYIVSLSDEKFKNLKYISKTTLDIIMNDSITISDINDAYVEVEQFIESNPFDNDKRIKEVANEIIKNYIKPNSFYDHEKTLTLREQAKNSIEPVVIKKGDIIVTEGDYIDKRTYEKLNAAGLLKDTSSLWPYFGLLLLVALLLLLIYFSIERMKPELHQNNKSLLMLLVILTLTFASISIIGLISEKSIVSPKGFLAPVAFGVMLITLYLSLRFAILTGVIFSVFASLVFNSDQTMIFDFRYGFVLLIGSTAGAFAIGKIKQRSSILKAGLVVALFNSLAILMLLMLTSQSYSLREGIESVLYGIIGGLFAAVLTIGFMPFFEAVFGILSPINLIELSNPNHPLLRKLLIETPGTYHHSIIVGNLAESAAEAIGANGLLARVGAYYHDLGKTKRPTFFIENQLNMENPHDKISPSLSKNIIISHTKDGVQMLKEHKLPVPIQDIAMQHHGTSLLKYFYNKAVNESDVPIDESEFRYPGPKPQTKEAAIVGLADSIEAAVRSLKNPTNELIEETVRKITKSKLNDGQFNECDLTLKEIEIISLSMLETLKGIFHSRIEYPDDKELEEKGAKTS